MFEKCKVQNKQRFFNIEWNPRKPQSMSVFNAFYMYFIYLAKMYEIVFFYLFSPTFCLYEHIFTIKFTIHYI